MKSPTFTMAKKLTVTGRGLIIHGTQTGKIKTGDYLICERTNTVIQVKGLEMAKGLVESKQLGVLVGRAIKESFFQEGDVFTKVEVMRQCGCGRLERVVDE